MEQAKMDRISELTRIARDRALTAEECAEREVLRRAYLDEWRRGAEAVLERVRVEGEGQEQSPTQQRQTHELQFVIK